MQSDYEGMKQLIEFKKDNNYVDLNDRIMMNRLWRSFSHHTLCQFESKADYESSDFVDYRCRYYTDYEELNSILYYFQERSVETIKQTSEDWKWSPRGLFEYQQHSTRAKMYFKDLKKYWRVQKVPTWLNMLMGIFKDFGKFLKEFFDRMLEQMLILQESNLQFPLS